MLRISQFLYRLMFTGADIKVASRIDREELAPTGGLGWINFTLQGRDLGEMSSRFSELFIHLRITDVNDNDPKFLQQRYEVLNNIKF